MEVSGMKACSLTEKVRSPVGLTSTLEDRIDVLSKQKVLLQDDLQLLQKEGERCIPSICGTCPFLEAGKAYTVETLTQQLRQLLLKVQREESDLQDQCDRSSSGSDLEKHCADLSLEAKKKGRTEQGQPLHGQPLPPEAQPFLETLELFQSRLAWAMSEHLRIQGVNEILHKFQHTPQELEEIAARTGYLGRATLSELYRHVGAQMLKWTDQIHFIQNKLLDMQQSVVEEQLCQAIEIEDTDLLLRLRERYDIDFDRAMSTRGKGMTPLTYAIDKGKLRMVLFLLDTVQVGINQVDRSNQTNRRGMTPLLTAIMRGDMRIVDLLLARGVFVDLPVGDLLPISYAICLGRRELASKLISYPTVALNRRAPGGIGPFQAAISLRDTALIQLLKEKGADINGSDGTGMSPLTFALLHGKTGMVHVLCQFGADVKQPDRLGHIPEQMLAV